MQAGRSPAYLGADVGCTERCRELNIHGVRIGLVDAGGQSGDRCEKSVKLHQQRLTNIRRGFGVHLLVVAALSRLRLNGLVRIVAFFGAVSKKPPIENQIDVFGETFDQAKNL
jgi:hypothetical protein